MNITAKMLSTLLNDNFHISMLMSDDSNRKSLSKITVEEVDTLISNLTVLREHVVDNHDRRLEEAKELLQRLIGESTTFSSVDDLLNTLGQSHTQTETTTLAKAKGYKTFEVVLTDSKKDERRTYTITNKVITKSLRNDPVYQALINKNPELIDVDEFLRAYSEEYRNTYKINAKWDGNEFHINMKGKLNSKSMKYFEEYKKKYPNGNEQSFKELVQTNYKKP
ncbi:hypothetical protein ACKQC9_27290 [Klebsiella michiganensis]|uniref:hypothetical protein n=1 Tax=Klebsiella michiganensis TaxID=1134687 RepID=UPI003D6F7641